MTGCVLVINYPIFSIYLKQEPTSNFLNQLFVDFYSSTFKEELASYWTQTVSGNFLTYSDPDRENKHFWLTGHFSDLDFQRNESVSIEHSETVDELSLLDIDSLLRKSTVVQNFINNHGEAIYQSKLNSFLQSVCILLDLNLEDLYFEQDVRILCSNNYTIETHKLT